MRFNGTVEKEKYVGQVAGQETVVNGEQSLLVVDPQIEIQKRVEETQLALQKSPEVLALAKSLDVENPMAILEFGAGPADEISKFSDKILSTVKNNTMEESSEMLNQLTKVLKKIDIEEIKTDKKGGLVGFFENKKRSVEKLLSKYQSVGGEIDKIYVEITGYKEDMKKDNQVLEDLYQQNLQYYEALEKYIVAGNMVIQEMETEDIPYYVEKAQSGTQIDVETLNTVKTVMETLKTRVYDLEMARMVALQTAPQIRMIQKGNIKLVSKIHSAFVVTIPIFKTALIEAVTLKKQSIVSKSLNALDEATNQALLLNAKNIKDQSIQIAQMTSSPSVKIETLEKTWQLMLEGVEEVSRIEKENETKRIEGLKKIHLLQGEMNQKLITTK